jgi:hypothetical protein
MIIHQSAARAEDTVAQLIRELGEKDAALELMQKQLDELRKMNPQQNVKPGVVSNSPLNMSIASLASGGWSTVETKKKKSISESSCKAAPSRTPKLQAIVYTKIVTKAIPKASFKISLIPNSRCGRVMGKQGSAMKEIQSRSGCKIYLNQAMHV